MDTSLGLSGKPTYRHTFQCCIQEMFSRNDWAVGKWTAAAVQQQQQQNRRLRCFRCSCDISAGFMGVNA